MKLEFVNGKEKKCSKLIEQKLFLSNNAAGWLCSISITEAMTSEEIDDLFEEDNIAELTLIDETANTTVCIKGYSKVTSVVAKHTGGENNIVEVQMTKGVSQ